MTEPTLHYVACDDAQGGHRMAYWQWGDAFSAHVVVCVHGLTRQGRDFDALAQAIVARAGGNVRVVCPDVVGPRAQRLAARPELLPSARVCGRHAGAAGAVAAEQRHRRARLHRHQHGRAHRLRARGPQGTAAAGPIRRFVANDVGPTIEPAAVQRIGAYVGKSGRFASVQAAADAMWALSTTSVRTRRRSGWRCRSTWWCRRRSVRPMARPRSTGDAGDAPDAWLLHYDPAIGVPLRAITPEAAAQGGAIMWSAVRRDRGAHACHARRGVRPAVARHGPGHDAARPEGRAGRVRRRGHAPTFVDPAQIAAVTDFSVRLSEA
jgi:hypothetical protein